MSKGDPSSEGRVDAAVVEYLASSRSLDGGSDVVDVAPAMTYDDAYRAQFASKARQSPLNCPIIGYQASITSEAARRLVPADMPKPYFGVLQLRNWRNAEAPVPVNGRAIGVECEVGMRMAAPLRGPGLTAADARRAVASVHAALEIVPVPAGLAGRSGRHMIAIHNFGSYVVFGDAAASPDLDLVREPIELWCDGVLAASAVAGDSGGDPFAVLAELANTLGRFGRQLEPGMVVMTGSATPPQRLAEGVKQVEGRFGRLGGVSARFV